MFDINKIREDFPILQREIYGHPLVYLDNAATTQKPRLVVDAISEEYYNENANVHRGVHFLSQQATDLYEQAREHVRQFIGAESSQEIIFTRGTTESINLLAFSFGETFCHSGDEIIVSAMEHHSNLVPWQMLAKRKGLTLRFIPILADGTLDTTTYETLFNAHTRLVAFTHVSNVLGTVNPVASMIQIAHQHAVPVLIDGAQSTPHLKVDVRALDCDFFAFSGHKIYGPTGIGVLYGKSQWLEQMPPYQGGGEMIKNVTLEQTTYNALPYRFEAGTPDYVGAHSLAVALEYVEHLGIDNIMAHERALTAYALEQMRQINGMTIYGHANDEVGAAVISFNISHIHHLDLGTLLDRLGIAVRTGHHCAEPLVHRFGVEGMVRASFAFYNTREEIDTLVAGIRRVQKMF